MRKLLLVATPILDFYQQNLLPSHMDGFKHNPHLGVYYLAGIVRERTGWEVEVLDLVAAESADAGLLRAAAAGCDLVGFSCNSMNWSAALSLIRLLRAESGAPRIVVGGMHPTLFPEHAMDVAPIDFAVAGEGEVSLVRLLEHLDGTRPVSEVPGLLYRDGDAVRRNARGPLLGADALAEMPLPAYDLLPAGRYNVLSVETARGCLSRCRFCAIPYPSSWRAIDAERTAARLAALAPYLERVRGRQFCIVDDCFTTDPQRVCDVFAATRRRGVRLRATMDGRAVDISEALVTAIRPAMGSILIGAESGYAAGLKQARKPATLEIIERAAQRLLDGGISGRAFFSFILGFPWETADDCRRTLDFAAKMIQRYRVRVSLQWHVLMPGSAIWRDEVEAGRVVPADLDAFGFFNSERWFLRSCRLTEDEVIAVSQDVLDLAESVAERFPGEERMGLGKLSFTMPLVLKRLLEGEAPVRG